MILAGKLAFLAITLAAFTGCGGDGGDRGHGGPDAPEFDLTGVWKTTESDCQSYSGDLSESELAEFDPGTVAEGEEDPVSEIVQSGNHLEITDLETGQQIEGTISGNRIEFEASIQIGSDGVETDLSTKGEGEALDAYHITVTLENAWAFTFRGETFAGETICTSQLKRVGYAESQG